jgi:hypothetical protein
MQELSDRSRNLLIILLATVLIKVASLAFIYTAVSTNLLAQLTTKWDAVFYIDIAKNGYPSGILNANYAFAPMYPAMIRLAESLTGNFQQAAVFASMVFSLLTPIMFYFVAERYLSSQESLYASLAFAFFPTIVTYGLVSYSEPVYLFFAMMAMYFFQRGRYFITGVAMSFAVLSGYANLLAAGLLICILGLPKAYVLLKRPRSSLSGAVATGTKEGIGSRVGFLWLFLPFVVFGIWMYALDVSSGRLFSIIAAQAPWGTSLANPIAQFQTFFTGVFSTQGNPVQQLLLRYMYTIPFFSLAYPLWKIDKGLTFYSSAFMLFTLSLVGTAYASGPRLMLAAWPLILVFGRMRKDYLFPVLVLFAALAMQSNYSQLTSFWT